MKIALLDEQGNVVTPRKGDYVMACDIDNEEMHNAIRDAFADAGCEVTCGGKFNDRSPESLCFKLVRWPKSNNYFCWDWNTEYCDRRLYPNVIKKTLFEAACEADDGAQFRIDGTVFNKVREMSREWALVNNYGKHAEMHYLERTDFEQLPSGPKKRDVCVNEILVHVPRDMINDFQDAFSLIGRLAMWEGAQIGKPGYSIGELRFETDNPLPYIVTFKTAEQCEAAWKAECPEMFE